MCRNSIQSEIKKTLFICCLLVFTLNTSAQKNTGKGDVIVDENGVMRWENNNEEVHGFGVNYSVPFAHAYRSAKRMGIDPKEAIDNDVYHFTRLGFDLYRLHVWDTQISDTEGNLIENEYLETFDYLLKKLKDNNINYVITPIAFWGNGWPEPDTDSPGFSHKYGKGDCLTNPDAIKAQHNYLEQFLNHVNPYTGVAYKNEPNIIAFEVSNEPHHRGEAKKVTEFVKGMVESMRKTGTKKPIFYNMSHGVHFVNDYFKGNVQGGTFQWYPTGLGYGKELSGNLLPNVNDYNITFEDEIKKHNGAKLVYEFDAADVAKSYMYPAMARSFRTAGIQIGTHFAYDPTYLAANNTEYNTHYMNLNYAPQKALSLKICAEIFHEIPMYTEFGTYPENTSFGNFTVNYENDVATYNSGKKFFYTNTTDIQPKNESKLTEIAGSGNSSIVKYDGSGAYFLDKIDEGVWRLEVQPDVIWVDNLFGRNSPKKTVAVINWSEHKMKIQLDNLGEKFSIEGINDGNSNKSKVDNSNFNITPGTYILFKKGTRKKWSKDDAFGTNKLKDFYAPKTTVNKPYFQHQTTKNAVENSEIKIEAQFIAPTETKEILLTGYNSEGNYFNQKMEYIGNYKYATTITSEYTTVGLLNYSIIVTLKNNNQITYPSSNEGNLYDWDFYDNEPYSIMISPISNPIYVFNAIDDTNDLVRTWRRSFKLIPTANNDEAEYQMNLDKLFYPDNENLNATPIYDYTFKHFILDKIKENKKSITTKKELVFHGRSLNNKPCKLQIALVMSDGSSFGKVIEIGTKIEDYKILLTELKPVKTVTLPRPYPSFLPYYFEHNNQSKFDISKVESIQFSIGPEIPQKELEDSHGIGIININFQ
ncbi:glycoside hydrolase 5 family protein [Urechidicola croceus]|uniref:Uncharacterized protein n=1 Tax=Urechidicola croceus TaxID=1850246 RepID=A0A1D8P6H5_9FLAO|nr:cellulase family glycosylhydrolase [Urechidicola croceus]AOW20137.1 hypothetical protein LPB138_05335 [Urechidicola croceus]